LLIIRCCGVETQRIFSLSNILTNLKGCQLQLENFKNLIFINKNWLNDPRIGGKTSSNLVEFIETNVDLEKELKEFESEFEKEEIVDM
jgi:hypothetical protein